MSELTERVREGLTEKVAGLETALQYVRDPREIERLGREIAGANEALARLEKGGKVTSEEEANKILSQLDEGDEKEETVSWSKMTPHEKFLYHFELYADRLMHTEEEAKEQFKNLTRIVEHLKAGVKAGDDFMDPIIKQFEASLAEIGFSGNRVHDQLDLYERAQKIAKDEIFFAKLEILNRFLNNPMSLPHLSEEFEASMEALRNAKN